VRRKVAAAAAISSLMFTLDIEHPRNGPSAILEHGSLYCVA
jgi:hypothetical protein